MSFLGGLLGTAVSALAGHWSAKQNSKISQGQWAYQQSNAHQLEVQDLKNAGLNPILSATNSQISSVPSVSDNGVSGASANAISSALQASVSKENAKLQAETEGQRIDNERKRLELDKERYSFQNRLDASQIGLNNVNSAYLTSKMQNELDLTNAQIAQINVDIDNSIKLTDAQVANLASGTALNYREADLVSAQISQVVEETKGIKINNKLLNNILTDPRATRERQLIEEGFKNHNALGILFDIGVATSAFGNTYKNLLPNGSSISFGKSGARYGVRN